MISHIGDPLACTVCANECEQKVYCEFFLGFHSSVIDDTGCLGCDAVLLGDWFTVVLKTVFLLGFKAREECFLLHKSYVLLETHKSETSYYCII